MRAFGIDENDEVGDDGEDEDDFESGNDDRW
jgi:hypothetical protein